jgi:hypothetical protein
VRSQNPWAWLGVLALALPVLIHLFSRRPARIESFPSLRFLDASRLLPTRRTQLTDVPLLLVRLAILLFAVAALAQPVLRAGADRDASIVARAIIVDTAGLYGDSVARAAITSQIASLTTDGGATTQLLTAHPRDMLAGAVEWLRDAPGRDEVLVVSPFAHHVLDSLDLVGVPSSVTMRLIRSRASSSASAPLPLPRDAVWWAHAPFADSSGVLPSVRALGARTVGDSAPSGGVRRTIVVTTVGADSLAAWTRVAQPLNTPWMGDAVAAMARDSTLRSVSAGIGSSGNPRTQGVEPRFVVVSRSGNGAPAVFATRLPGAGSDRLLLVVRDPAQHLLSASLLLAASTYFAPLAPASDTSAPSDEALRRWERAPAAAPSSPSLRGRADYYVGASDARYFWILVLLLIGVETLMRRRAAVASAGAAAAPSTRGAANG